MNIYGIQKDSPDEPIHRAAMQTHTKRTDIRTRARERKERVR